MNTGEKICLVRKKRHLTQDYIATLLNISQRAYSKIENNEVQVKINRLEEIAKILGVACKDLLSDNRIQNIDNQNADGHFIATINNKERELFEKIIDRQQGEIDYLKGIIDVIKR